MNVPLSGNMPKNVLSSCVLTHGLSPHHRVCILIWAYIREILQVGVIFCQSPAPIHSFRLNGTCCFAHHASWHSVCRLRIQFRKPLLLPTSVRVVHEAQCQLGKPIWFLERRSGVDCLGSKGPLEAFDLAFGPGLIGGDLCFNKPVLELTITASLHSINSP